MRRKGAVELSINFLVIIIVSVAILAGGLALFFKLKAGAQQTVETLDDQVKQQLKSLMLSNNYNVAVWPNQVELSPGKSVLIGLGITSTLPDEQTFIIPTSFSGVKAIKYYKTPTSAPISINTSINNDGYPDKWTIKVNFMTSNSLARVKPQDQHSQGIFIRAPKNPPKGEYVIPFNIYNISVQCAGCSATFYGVAKVYIVVN